MRLPRLLLGIAVWVMLGVLLHHAAGRASEDALKPARSAIRHLLIPPHRVKIVFPHRAWTQKGDRLCVRTGPHDLVIGQVESTSDLPSGSEVWAVVFPEHAHLLTTDARIRLVYNHRTPAWVVKTLFPPSLRKEIGKELEKFLDENKDEFVRTLWPDLKRILIEACGVVEDDFQKALDERSGQIEKLFEKHRSSTFEKELLPVLKKEAWTVVKDESKPLVEKIGKKLWDRLPMWGLGWRWMAEKIPFTDDDMVRRRFEAYVEKDAVPILKAHTREFIDLAGRIFKRLARNKRIKKSIQNGLVTLTRDEDFIALIEEILEDVFLSSSRLLDCLLGGLKDPAFLKKLTGFLEPLTPVINRIADRILLDAKGVGINPNLARVLRTQLFLKDRAWFLVEPGKGPGAESDHSFQGVVYTEDES